MTPFPDETAFGTAYAAGQAQVVWTRLVSDLETPVAAMLKLAQGRPFSFLLESVTGGSVRGRYSLIGLKPDLIWKSKGTQAWINRRAATDLAAFEPLSAAPLDALADVLEESRIDLPAHLPPMSAGLFGYLGYDMVRLMEKLPEKNRDALGVEDAVLIRPTIMAIFDSIENVVTLVTPVRPQAGVSAEAAYLAARERLADAVADLDRPLPVGHDAGSEIEALPDPSSNISRADYHAMVEKAKEYIRAGDIFQVVPSQRFSVPFALPPFALYRALRRINPSPFLFFLDFGDLSVVGSSPEILVRLRDDTVTIRPIAGTRRRGKTPAEDKELEADLLADPKELSEHLMLLDLGRNDVGRVAEVGTVTVTERFTIEHYSHVMHIVSNVEGKLDKSRFNAIDALVGGFPAGTVSGAPKVRAMEIIEELEGTRRGIYGGCIGYFAANGTMDTCIALRTAVIKDGVMHVQAGGGVVADSDPEAEYQETVNKAKALFKAAEEAVRYAQEKRSTRNI
ncbi:anthranilate synthase component I [Nitrospirillum viridazoti]|uniref:Anthranilate synthase component 1 n=1 Tax=Nitrospirillum viridazoti CBAmc TaxID=1441467 RepID=A0A248JQ75_9PROT|nr:anthranilate synthase component I [Nitrospirillum amazonense]ASG20749.1 anthranilate synthase component I [Nitrospirillum amazonense CBAmc]TWB37923.1 anthranilate synthase component 1 [Nitrospirillum amazonense]